MKRCIHQRMLIITINYQEQKRDQERIIRQINRFTEKRGNDNFSGINGISEPQTPRTKERSVISNSIASSAQSLKKSTMQSSTPRPFRVIFFIHNQG